MTVRVLLLLGLFMATAAHTQPEGSLRNALVLMGQGAIGLGMLLRLPAAWRFLWRGPDPPARPRLWQGQRLAVPDVWSRLGRPGLALAVLLSVLLQTPVLFFMVAPPIMGAIFCYDLLRGGGSLQRGIFAGQLAYLVRVEVPVADAVEELATRMRGNFWARYSRLPVQLAYLAFDLRAGAQLSAAVAVQQDFPPIWAALLRVAERTGQLPEILDELSRQELQSGFRADLAAHAFKIPIFGAILWFVSQFSLPTFDRLLEQLAQPRWIAVHTALYWVGAAMCVSSLGILMLRVFRVKRPATRWRAALQLLPPFDRLTRATQQIQVLRAILVGARHQRPLYELLELGAGAATHPAYRQALVGLRADSGSDLRQLLASCGSLFDPEILWLIGQGERQDLSEALAVATGLLEDRLSEQRERLDHLETMVLQIAFGALICLFGASIFAPLLDIYDASLYGGFS